MKKYEIRHDGRIVALVSGPWGDVGTVGGFVDLEANLSHTGGCWIYGDAEVSGDAKVSGDAEVSGKAYVFGNAQVSDDAQVYGNAHIYGNTTVYGNARVYGYAKVFDNARIYGHAWVSSGKQTVNISINPFVDAIEEMVMI